ncbi:MAG TPA: ester cyclase [Chloroflexota bacterium]|jgi:steroid delta-isomerase-like uncharacterized protein
MALSAREVFENGTDAFNAHDLDGFAAVLAEDVEFHAPGGISGEGKDACAGFFGSWFTAFPDAHVDVHAAHVLGDVVVEEGTFTGTHRGVLHGLRGDLPATNRSVAVDYVQVLRFRDGRHVSFNLMFDQLQLLAQLGVLPNT